MVKIEFADVQVEEIYDSDMKLRRYIRKRKAPHTPEDIYWVISRLSATSSVQDLPAMFNYHLLKHELSGYAAVDVRRPGDCGRGKWRLIFKPISDCNDINNKSTIKHIIIKELLEDYHKRSN